MSASDRKYNIGPFAWKSQPYNKTTYTITCGACGATEEIPNQTMGLQLAKQKLPGLFTRREWKVGSNERKHRCPTCQHGEKTMSNDTATTNVIPIAAEPPQKATVEDRRIIMEKLQDVYGEKGYTAGWCDAKVASDLGVPRAYVAEVREFSFGPEIDGDQAAAQTAAKKALHDASLEFDALTLLADRTAKTIEAGLKRARESLDEAKKLARRVGVTL